MKAGAQASAVVPVIARPVAAPMDVDFGSTAAGGGGPSYSPSLDFSDARNSQYEPLIFEDI